jgi:hypothetical protein
MVFLHGNATDNNKERAQLVAYRDQPAHIARPVSCIQVTLYCHLGHCLIACVSVCVRLQLILADDVCLPLLQTAVATSCATPFANLSSIS